MPGSKFIGRKAELEQLARLLEKKSSSLIVIRGRRRIGKTTLIQHFAELNQLKLATITGLPLTPETTADMQRKEFAEQLCSQFNLPAVATSEWSELFRHLNRAVSNQPIVVLLDEISWMGSEEPDFLGKLKNAWDNEFKKNSNLILVLCGSVSSWIEKNILSSTGFLGRLSRQFDLKQLSLQECYQFWQEAPGVVAPYEIFKVLAITGGIPRYLEEILPHRSAEQNIQMLCFEPEGFLVSEFERIFTDALMHRSPKYRLIVRQLCEQALSADSLLDTNGEHRGGTLSSYLDDLELAGFITRDFTWNFKTEKASKFSQYRLSDNYSRFYLKYIEPNKSAILNGDFRDRSLSALPAWSTVLGLQFENLVIANRHLLYEAMGLKKEEIIASGPFFQRATKRKKGCQIDLLIQTQFGTLYPIEIKFSKHPVTTAILTEMKRKVDNLALPRHISIRPVLVHVNGVDEAVQESKNFAHIIDFGSLLSKP
ncbi:MAG: ATP-binding protein [Myxococcaceae bacterium]